MKPARIKPPKYSGALFLVIIYSLTCLIECFYLAIHEKYLWVLYLFMGLIVPLVYTFAHVILDALDDHQDHSPGQEDTLEIDKSLVPRVVLEDTIDAEDLNYLREDLPYEEELIYEEGDYF